MTFQGLTSRVSCESTSKLSDLKEFIFIVMQAMAYGKKMQVSICHLYFTEEETET